MSQTIAQIGPHGAGPKHSGQMRAGVYRGQGRVVVESVPIPRIGEGEVLFRVAACGVCGTDIKKIHHGFIKPPQILGHELAGTVVETGRGVEKFKLGDRVVSFHHVPCGGCFYCRKKLFSQCAGYKKVGLTAGFDPNGGGFAEYVRAMPWVVERGMIALPDDVSFEEATFVEPVNTCLKAVRKARVAPGETIVVLGQGPVGMLLTALAKNEGGIVY
ncbi:MAG: alcohol dehydrogenase catalytic domain-containing protein, partial [Candidatus Acidiferrales bacterium]